MNQGSIAPRPAVHSTEDLLMSAGPTTDKGFYRDTNLFQYTHSNHKQVKTTNSQKTSLLTPDDRSLQLSKSKSKASKGSQPVNNFHQGFNLDTAVKPPRSPEKPVSAR